MLKSFAKLAKKLDGDVYSTVTPDFHLGSWWRQQLVYYATDKIQCRLNLKCPATLSPVPSWISDFVSVWVFIDYMRKILVYLYTVVTLTYQGIT